MCYFCGTAVPRDMQIGFSAICPDCGKELHVCLMCRFYAPGAHWDCRETIDALVQDKEKRNFCEWFAVNEKYFVKAGQTPAGIGKAESAKKKFDSLFKS